MVKAAVYGFCPQNVAFDHACIASVAKHVLDTCFWQNLAAIFRVHWEYVHIIPVVHVIGFILSEVVVQLHEKIFRLLMATGYYHVIYGAGRPLQLIETMFGAK